MEWDSEDDPVGDGLGNPISHEVCFNINAFALGGWVLVLLPEVVHGVTLNQVDDHHSNKPSEREKSAEVKHVGEARDWKDAVIEHDHRHLDRGDCTTVDKLHSEDQLSVEK